MNMSINACKSFKKPRKRKRADVLPEAPQNKAPLVLLWVTERLPRGLVEFCDPCSVGNSSVHSKWGTDPFHLMAFYCFFHSYQLIHVVLIALALSCLKQKSVCVCGGEGGSVLFGPLEGDKACKLTKEGQRIRVRKNYGSIRRKGWGVGNETDSDSFSVTSVRLV